jgi:rod shape-determining protein MreC
MLLTWLMLGGFIFLFAPPAITSRFHLAFARIFSLPLSLGRSISLATRASSSAETVSRREYDRLNTEYNQLMSHLHNVTQQRDQEYEKAAKLAGLRAIPDWNRMNFVPAHIVTVSDRTQTELIINRGQTDGLVKGQFVLGDNAVIGTISDCSATRAKIKLITDPTSRIPVKVIRSTGDKQISVTDGLLHGSSDNTPRIPLIPLKTGIEAGDIVYARQQPGLGVPIVIGKIAQCKKDNKNPLLWDITVQPLCDIEKLADVAVIVEKK